MLEAFFISIKMNYKGKTQIAGINVPNIILYGIIIAVLLFVFGIFKAIKNIFSAGYDKISGFFGINNADQTEQTAKDITNALKNDEGVTSQMNNGNRDKAELLFKAMNGMGTDTKTIHDVFRTITGPNQMKAIFLLFGTRTLNWMSWYSAGPAYPISMGANMLGGFTGTLSECLRNELSNSDMNYNLAPEGKARYSVQTSLNWINQK